MGFSYPDIFFTPHPVNTDKKYTSPSPILDKYTQWERG